MYSFLVKTCRSYACLCLIVFGYSVAISQNSRIVEIAQKDVGTLERTRNNDNPLFDFYRITVAKDLNRWKAPYCGCAVYSWHLLAGLKPKNPAPAVALSWKRTKGIPLGQRTTAKEVQSLKPGMVVLMKFSRYHVGILKTVYPSYAITIEGNTSNINSVNRLPGKSDGVMEKIRPYQILIGAYDWHTDAEKVDSLKYKSLRNQFVKP